MTEYVNRFRPSEAEIERRFDANVILWGSDGQPQDWNSNEQGAYVDLHDVVEAAGRSRPMADPSECPGKV